MTIPVTQFSGNNGSIRLDDDAVSLNNKLFGGERRLPYQHIRVITLTEPTWLMQGNLSVVTTDEALSHLLGTKRMRNVAAGNVAAWKVNVTKSAFPKARALKAEFERRLAIVRGQS